MRRPLHQKTASERTTLGSIAVLCYSTTLVSLAALAYSVCILALDSAGDQIKLIYSRFGI